MMKNMKVTFKRFIEHLDFSYFPMKIGKISSIHQSNTLHIETKAMNLKLIHQTAIIYLVVSLFALILQVPSELQVQLITILSFSSNQAHFKDAYIKQKKAAHYT